MQEIKDIEDETVIYENEDLTPWDILDKKLEWEFTIDMELDSLPWEKKYLIYKDNFKVYINADWELCFEKDATSGFKCQAIPKKENWKFQAKIHRGVDNKISLNDVEKEISVSGELKDLQIWQAAGHIDSWIVPNMLKLYK
jgi:hypothetical protein